MKSLIILFLLLVICQANPPDGSFTAFGTAQTSITVENETIVLVDDIPIVMANDQQDRQTSYHMQFALGHIVSNETGTYIWDPWNEDVYFENSINKCSFETVKIMKLHTVPEIRIPKFLKLERYYPDYGMIIISIEFRSYAIGIPDPKVFNVPGTSSELLDYCSLFD